MVTESVSSSVLGKLSTVQLLDFIFVNSSGIIVCKGLFHSHNSLRNGSLYQPQRESF